MPATVACVLRSGKEYGPAHVAWLKRQIATHDPAINLVCLSNVAVPCERIPLVYDWPGWWAKFEICRPHIRGDLLYLDLDTVTCGSLQPLLSIGRTTGLRDFNRKGESFQSSVMYLTEADRAAIWDAWLRKPNSWIEQAGSRGDQWVLEQIIGRTSLRWQDVLPGHFVSYKNDIVKEGRTDPPPSARVVVFHGQPRPWDVSASWVPPLIPKKDLHERPCSTVDRVSP